MNNPLVNLDEGMEGFVTGTPSEIIPIQSGKPGYDIKHEKAVHRLMCYRSACGDTPMEIAEATGFNVASVRQILKQDRSKLLISQIQHEKFGDNVQEMLRGGAVDAILSIRNLSVEAESESVKLNASKDILDRFLGKPVSRNENLNINKDLDPEEEARQIEIEIKRLEEEDV